MNTIIYYLAEYSIIILILISLLLLWNNQNLFCYYVIGISVNEIVNFLLKNLIKQDRPNNDKVNKNIVNDDPDKQMVNDDPDKQMVNDDPDKQMVNNNDVIDKEIVIYDKNKLLSDNIQKYGMPSGHAQSSAFSTMFIYLSLHNIYLTSIFVIITLIASFQRINLYFHTVEQVIVGILVGSFVSYFFYKLALKNYFPTIYRYKFLFLLILFYLFNWVFINIFRSFSILLPKF
jgi:membrane-associated phospholipid phosphatase